MKIYIACPITLGVHKLGAYTTGYNHYQSFSLNTATETTAYKCTLFTTVISFILKCRQINNREPHYLAHVPEKIMARGQTAT